MKQDLTKLALLERRIKIMKRYMLMKFSSDDYHGVADAAMDLREMMVELKYERQLAKIKDQESR